MLQGNEMSLFFPDRMDPGKLIEMIFQHAKQGFFLISEKKKSYHTYFFLGVGGGKRWRYDTAS